jgi:DNA-directed RNA polymerase sigma subunit (sigma70/sigma32)
MNSEDGTPVNPVWEMVSANFEVHEATILDYRYGFIDRHAHTLEETSNEFGLSREDLRILEDRLQDLLDQMNDF